MYSRRTKDLFKNGCKKKNYITFLIFFLDLVINSVVKIFIIKHNLFCQLPADFFFIPEERDLSFSDTL